MTNKEFKRVANQLLPKLPAPFSVQGALMVMRPIRHVLRAICLDSSGFDADSFYLWAFHMLLCVPSKHVVLTLGQRLRYDRRERWDRTDPELSSRLLKSFSHDALPLLERSQTPRDIAKGARRMRGYPPDHNIQQTFAFALARCGRIRCARLELKCLIKLSDSDVAWEREIAERASTLTARINEGRESSDRLLDSWERETAHNLGLSRLLSADNPDTRSKE